MGTRSLAGRAGSNEEMGMLVIFLTKCGYVNGEIIRIDGGVMNEVRGQRRSEQESQT